MFFNKTLTCENFRIHLKVIARPMVKTLQMMASARAHTTCALVSSSSKPLLSWPAFLLISFNRAVHFVRNSATMVSKISRGRRNSLRRTCNNQNRDCHTFVCIGITVYKDRSRQHVYTWYVLLGLGQESAAASDKCGNELFGCTKCSHFHEYQNNYGTDKKRSGVDG
jgi:hypothetical protein